VETKLDNFTTAIILAGGSGTRMKTDKTKQRIEILGESVLKRCVRAFNSASKVNAIVVVCRMDEITEVKELVSDMGKVVSITSGGDNRRESAMRGFEAIPRSDGFVAVHDAARCLITPAMIDEVIGEAHKFGAATAVSEVVDTVKLYEDGYVQKTLNRESLRLAQTPQVFSVDLYKKAVENSAYDVNITDDNMMVEKLGVKIRAVNTSSQNIKITTPDDLLFAEFILKKRMENE
jgi:2-C-methyl-D-erythritol 4-phosphate cytidylyltransferase